ncbi:MAG: hypothetical protein IPO08_21565 [Xanthomonadales bacterium]|nr:hypothetical protein [Xanthomonadales bacterium]
MTEAMAVEVIKQGGFAVACLVMFLLYRSDSKGWQQKQSETVSALMGLSERTSTTLTKLGETQASLTLILARIETHLDRNHLCPVTQVSSELLRDVGSVPGRRNVDRVVRDAISSAVIAHSRADVD